MVAALVSAVVGALLGAALSPVTNNVMAQVFKLIEKDRELWDGFKEDMVSLQKDLRMLFAKDQEDQLSGKRDPSAVGRIYKKDMQDLSYDIQDCMDRILCYSECSRGNGKDLAKEVKRLKERLAHHANKQQSSNNDDHSQLLPCLIPEKLRSERLVGIKEPKEDLLEVLKGHPQEELSVISIAGFSGFGRTTLARAVYDDCADQFDCRAWVVATEHKNDATDLLMALQEELSKNDVKYPQGGHVDYNITSFLKNKRFLIVLDDIEERQWNNIKSIFPKEKRSRIIVTTTNQAVANLCSKHGRDGYVYNMRPLEKAHSLELLRDILKDNLAVSDKNLAEIVEKFDGHPHCLLSVAQYLLKKEEFPGSFWVDLGDRMNDADEDAFTRLNRDLTEHFRSLRGRHNVNLKILLLYICVFPNTHPVGRSRLIRRWLAEGYVQHDDPHQALHFADDNLDKLIELNIVRRIDPSKNAKVKTCRVHGIIYVFLLHFARLINFITNLDDAQRREYRHLFLEGRPGGVSNVSGTSSDEKEELRAHSLTVCGSAGAAVGYFPKCELLRVLDLEECNQLEDEDTVNIHKMWHLKYLSLGNKITEVPGHIEELHCLETLDLRKTQIGSLPVEVIKLPHLAHLLGKFKLEKTDWENIKTEDFLPRRSNLRTLKGFLTDGNPGFPKLMFHMKELNKVKIWCNSKRDSPCCIFLSTAIKVFIQSRLDTHTHSPEDEPVDHCLSLVLGDSSKEILTTLQTDIQPFRDHSPESSTEIPCAYLSSLKLHGQLFELTKIITMVAGLRELCLSSTNGLTLDELSNLSKLITLVYLKLVGINLEGFVINRNDFRALRRLCLVKCTGFPEIRDEALTDLLSLRILNEDPYSLSGIQIRNLKKLQEVGLDSELNQKTKTEWEDAAKEHPKRPRVLFFKRVHADGTGSMVKYVAAKSEGSSVAREEQHIPIVQPMVEVQAKSAAAQENRDNISSDSQNSNSGGSDIGLKYGKSSHDCCPGDDHHRKMKQSNHDTRDEDEGEGKHDKIHNGCPEDKEELVIKETPAEEPSSARKSAVVTPVDNSNGKCKEDAAMQGKRDKELTAAKAGQSAKMATDDRLKQQHDDPVLVKAN